MIRHEVVAHVLSTLCDLTAGHGAQKQEAAISFPEGGRGQEGCCRGSTGTKRDTGSTGRSYSRWQGGRLLAADMLTCRPEQLGLSGTSSYLFEARAIAHQQLQMQGCPGPQEPLGYACIYLHGPFYTISF